MGEMARQTAALNALVLATQGAYPKIRASQTAAGTAFATYTTAKTVLNAAQLYTIPASTLVVGSKFRVEVFGGLSNIVTTPGTVTFQIMMGTVVAHTSGAIQLNATAHTLLPFHYDCVVRVDSIGAGTSAKMIGGATLSGIQPTLTAAQVDAVNTSGIFQGPVTAPAVGTGFDSTAANILDFWVGFSISNSGNGVQLYDYTVTQLA